MPDIAMCLNDDCPSCKVCYRYMAEPNPWRQSYMQFEPTEDGICDAFISLSPAAKEFYERSRHE